MPAIIVALILVSCVCFSAFLFIFIIKRQKRKQLAYMLHRFSTLGSEHNLSFSCQEILRNKIIGVDCRKRKIMILERLGQGGFDWYFIDLDEVKSCRIKRNAATLPVSTLMHKNHAPPGPWIALEFIHKKSGLSIAVPFYQHITHSVYEMKEMETKVKDWEAMLSKMLVSN